MHEPISAAVVAVMAFVSAIAIMLVRAMPRLIRVSLAVPLLYFGVIYMWAASTPMDIMVRTMLCRIGMLMIFASIIVNSALAIFADYRRI